MFFLPSNGMYDNCVPNPEATILIMLLLPIMLQLTSVEKIRFSIRHHGWTFF